MSGDEILEHQQLVREVVLAPHVQDYVSRLILATHPEGEFAAPATNDSLRWGSQPPRRPDDRPGGESAGPLGRPLQRQLRGRPRRVYLPAMRHRVILNFEAEAESVDPDDVLVEILKHVPETAEEKAA